MAFTSWMAGLAMAMVFTVVCFDIETEHVLITRMVEPDHICFLIQEIDPDIGVFLKEAHLPFFHGDAAAGEVRHANRYQNRYGRWQYPRIAHDGHAIGGDITHIVFTRLRMISISCIIRSRITLTSVPLGLNCARRCTSMNMGLRHILSGRERRG